MTLIEERLAYSIMANNERLERDEPPLRDRFAMAALTGICANTAFAEAGASSLASWAYEAADAMMAEREKVGGK